MPYGPKIDDVEKQAKRDLFLSQVVSFYKKYSSKYAEIRALSTAGALLDEWESQWDNPYSTECRATTALPRLIWECVNKDRAVYESIPLKHRFGNRAQDIAKTFSERCEDSNIFDIINLDLTCAFEQAMFYVELLLKNGWLRKHGLIAIWFDNGPRCEGKNRLFLKKHKTGYLNYLEDLLRKYGYGLMAKQGGTFEPYKQHNRSPKADNMVLLMVNAARPGSRKSLEMAMGENHQ
jgi:hypothetical protein